MCLIKKPRKIYEKISTRERLPLVSAYYSIETDVVHGYVHWSAEEQIWTLENGEKWEADYPNYWLEECVEYPVLIQSLN